MQIEVSAKTNEEKLKEQDIKIEYHRKMMEYFIESKKTLEKDIKEVNNN